MAPPLCQHLRQRRRPGPEKAWLSYTKADLNLIGALDLATLKTFTEAALHTRLLALLPASGLAREVDGQWLLQAQAD